MSNCLPITKIWNYTVGLFRPRDEILNGKWKFPQPQQAGLGTQSRRPVIRVKNGPDALEMGCLFYPPKADRPKPQTP
jgi:hypothetical protein